ncbi:DUF6082 family protein [Streptomyces sp. NPDC013161]|uniref:DUF6082 family protein n=1 Tax=Streptomyces sp. NPDC013161 TaxID=3364862 RepID=UPI0036B4C1C6
MSPRKPVDAVIEQMMHAVSPGERASEVHQVASMIADIGMRRAPTSADIDELRRLLSARSKTSMVWRTRGRRFGMSASRFLTGLSDGFAEARRESASRDEARHLGTEWRQHQEDYVTSLVSVHDMRLGLLREAIDNPDLAAALDVYGSEISAAKHRQFLFIEAVYRTYLLEWRVGAMTLEEFYGNLRILFQNPIFRQYWEATRNHRASLIQNSAEARIGRVVDGLILEMDEADTDEWWIVGEPPTTDGNV